MGSGDPSGLQNRRELASLALVSSTLTRFRQSFLHLCKQASTNNKLPRLVDAAVESKTDKELKAAYGQPARRVSTSRDGYKDDRSNAW